MQTVTIEVEHYAYPSRSHRFEIPAFMVGSLAIHRAAHAAAFAAEMEAGRIDMYIPISLERNGQ